MILDLLASGSMTLTSVRLLGKHLTAANLETVLARACGRTRREIEALVAELAPQPDVLASVRKLPTTTVTLVSPSANPAASSEPAEPKPAAVPLAPLLAPTTRPVVRASAPERYRVQFTMGEGTHEKFRRVSGASPPRDP